MINKIKGLKKFTDCSMPSNEIERIQKAEVASYNQAIDDVVKLFAIPDVIKSVCIHENECNLILTTGNCMKKCPNFQPKQTVL